MFDLKGIDFEELASKFVSTDDLDVGRKAYWVRSMAVSWQDAFTAMEKVKEAHPLLLLHRHRFDRYRWGSAVT